MLLAVGSRRQLLSYAEMLSAATNICSTLKDIPCIGDGDTGYGNAVNVKRTVKGYAQVRRPRRG